MPMVIFYIHYLISIASWVCRHGGLSLILRAAQRSKTCELCPNIWISNARDVGNSISDLYTNNDCYWCYGIQISCLTSNFVTWQSLIASCSLLRWCFVLTVAMVWNLNSIQISAGQVYKTNTYLNSVLDWKRGKISKLYITDLPNMMAPDFLPMHSKNFF